jgi:hypothetical protein
VKNNYWALNYASDRLRSDVNFCIECAKKKPEAIAYFLGKAKKIFKAHHNDVVAVEQQNANEALLKKLSTLKKLTTGEMTVSTDKLFKRKLDV